MPACGVVAKPVKAPPAHNDPSGATARARTAPFALGFHTVAAPVVASSPAMWLRAFPPIEPKLPPPAYTVEPKAARARTRLSAFGSQPVAAPVVTLTAAMWFRLW